MRQIWLPPFNVNIQIKVKPQPCIKGNHNVFAEFSVDGFGFPKNLKIKFLENKVFDFDKPILWSFDVVP